MRLQSALTCKLNLTLTKVVELKNCFDVKELPIFWYLTENIWLQAPCNKLSSKITRGRGLMYPISYLSPTKTTTTTTHPLSPTLPIRFRVLPFWLKSEFRWLECFHQRSLGNRWYLKIPSSHNTLSKGWSNGEWKDKILISNFSVKCGMKMNSRFFKHIL